MFTVYILESLQDGTLYTGQTKDLWKRVKTHNQGVVRATKGKAPYRLAYFETFETRREAMWREWTLKTKWSTDRKRRLIRDFDPEKVRAVSGLLPQATARVET